MCSFAVVWGLLVIILYPFVAVFAVVIKVLLSLWSLCSCYASLCSGFGSRCGLLASVCHCVASFSSLHLFLVVVGVPVVILCLIVVIIPSYSVVVLIKQSLCKHNIDHLQIACKHWSMQCLQIWHHPHTEHSNNKRFSGNQSQAIYTQTFWIYWLNQRLLTSPADWIYRFIDWLIISWLLAHFSWLSSCLVLFSGVTPTWATSCFSFPLFFCDYYLKSLNYIVLDSNPKTIQCLST